MENYKPNPLKLNLVLLLTGMTLPLPSMAKSAFFFDPLTELNQDLWWKSDGWSNGFPFLNSWEENSISYSKTGMSISLIPTNNPNSDFAYQSGELRSHKLYGYGCFEAEIKPVAKSGVVTSFFLFAGPLDQDEKQNGKHNEIDFEFLGNNMNMVQVNYWTNDDGYTNPHEQIIHLDFDASEEFHRYGIKWTKSALSWYIDGRLVHQVKNERWDPIPQASDSRLKIMANVWLTAPEISGWAGEFEATDEPLTAYYKNISYNNAKQCSRK